MFLTISSQHAPNWSPPRNTFHIRPSLNQTFFIFDFVALRSSSFIHKLKWITRRYVMARKYRCGRQGMRSIPLIAPITCVNVFKRLRCQTTQPERLLPRISRLFGSGSISIWRAGVLARRVWKDAFSSKSAAEDSRPPSKIRTDPRQTIQFFELQL